MWGKTKRLHLEIVTNLKYCDKRFSPSPFPTPAPHTSIPRGCSSPFARSAIKEIKKKNWKNTKLRQLYDSIIWFKQFEEGGGAASAWNWKMHFYSGGLLFGAGKMFASATSYLFSSPHSSPSKTIIIICSMAWHIPRESEYEFGYIRRSRLIVFPSPFESRIKMKT